MDKMQIYNHLPIWAQNLACYWEGRKIRNTRYSSTFWKKLNEYEERDKWSYEQKCEYRDKQLQKMIHHCYDTVPYYKKLFQDNDINPANIKSIEDLKHLPILTKDQVKENIRLLTSDTAKNIIVCPTGGTTGAGLKFLSNNDEAAEQWAVWWRYRRKLAISIDTLCGNFGGKQIVPLKQQTPPFWRYNKPNNQIYFSSYHISDKNVEAYAKFITEEGIQWLHGYASSIAELANYIIERNIQIPMKWVTVGSENLYIHQKEKIAEAFCTTPFMHYGLTEGVANISESKDGILAVDEDFACVEFIPTNENPDEYRIIGTPLTKFVMPLIRYDTGDIAIIKNFDKHNSDGRIIDSISGRATEYVRLPSGGKVGAAAISLAIHDFHFIKEMQIIQKKLDEIRVCIVVNKNADDFNDLNDFSYKLLKKSLQERFGSDMKIDVAYVDDSSSGGIIKKSKNGKHRLVVSEL